MALSRTAEYYRTHPKAREKKAEYDKKLQQRPDQKKKHAERVKHNRHHDAKYGKASRKGKDLAHTKHGLVYKKSSVNRGSKSDTAGDRKARGGGKRKK